MPAQTEPTYHWPIPEYDDYADGPKAFEDLGNGIDTSLKGVQTQVTGNGTAINTLNSHQAIYRVPVADTFITSTTLIDFPDFTVNGLVANGVYDFRLFLFMTGTSASTDLTFRFLYPAGSLMGSIIAQDPGATTEVSGPFWHLFRGDTVSPSLSYTAGVVTPGSFLRYEGTLKCNATGGNFVLQCARSNTTAGFNISASSHLRLQRISP